MALEVELKYASDGLEPLRTLADASVLGPAALGPAERYDEVDRYLDTADRRFADARWACRLRLRGDRTRVSLKGPAAAGTAAALHRRPEVEAPATDDLDPARWPPSEARALVDRLRAGRPLLERFRLFQDRTERAVAVDGERIGTLSLGRVRVEAGGLTLGALQAVELELDDPDADHEGLLDELDAALRRVAGLQAEERTKLEHAVDLVESR